MKLAIAILLAVSGALASAAHADDADNPMKSYFVCWAGSATALLDERGVSEETLVAAQLKADDDCLAEKKQAIASSGIYATDDARKYMETQLYEANPIPDTPTVQPEAKVSAATVFDPSTADLYQPKNPNAVFNAGFAWLCEFPNDVSKFRSLWAAGERQAALNTPGCIAVDKPLEGVETDSISDNLIQVSLVKDNQTIDMWTEKGLFQDRNSWLVDMCQVSGTDFSTCLDIVYR